MPTVRRIERQVAQDPLRGGFKQAAATATSEGAGVEQARAEKFGSIADFGERVTRFGASMYGRLVEEERAASDQAALMKASNELSDWKNRRLYDPNKGALTLKGEAAMPLPEDVRAEFNDVANGIEGSLATPEQRAAFSRLRSQEWQGIDLTVRRHVFGEVQAYRAQELKAHVDNSVNAAIASAADPKLVQVELQKAVSALERSGPGLCYGPEQIDEQVRAVTSKTHLGVISQLLATGNDKGAAAYFEASRDQIAGEALDQVQKALEEGELRGEGQRRADAIVSAGGTLTAQREKARAIDDPKLRDQVMQRIEHEATLKDRADREREESQQRQAFDIVDRTQDVTKIPPALWATFDGATRAGLHSYARARAKGEPIETDNPTYYSLMQQAGNDPATFAKTNLLQFRSKLDDGDFKSLAHLQLSIKNADRTATEKVLAPFQTRTQLVDDTLTLHGINPNAKPDTPEGKAIAQLRRMVDMRVDLLQQDGKKASNQDIQAEIDGILSTTQNVPGTWWAVLRPFTYDLASKQKRLIDVTVQDIPAGERSAVEAALKARGRPVSDATVLDLYIETKLRQSRKGGR